MESNDGETLVQKFAVHYDRHWRFTHYNRLRAALSAWNGVISGVRDSELFTQDYEGHPPITFQISE